VDRALQLIRAELVRTLQLLGVGGVAGLNQDAVRLR
jgi:L-lactate dehydrogenase (cytochrome)